MTGLTLILRPNRISSPHFHKALELMLGNVPNCSEIIISVNLKAKGNKTILKRKASRRIHLKEVYPTAFVKGNTTHILASTSLPQDPH